MWGLGVLAYVVAVMQRTSFGVASVMATERFDAGASMISLFVVVQLLTYAAMQVRAQTFRVLEMLTAMALIYWALGYPQAKLVDWIQRRYAVTE